MKHRKQILPMLAVLCSMTAATSCRPEAGRESPEQKKPPTEAKVDIPRVGEDDSKVQIQQASAKAEQQDPTAETPIAEESPPIEREDDFEVFWKSLQRMITEKDDAGIQAIMKVEKFTFDGSTKPVFLALAKTEVSKIEKVSETKRSLHLDVLVSTDEYGMEYWSGYQFLFDKVEGSWSFKYEGVSG